MSRARRLKADPAAADGGLEWDPERRSWHPAPRQHLSGPLLIGFGIAVLIYFGGEFARLVPWQAVL